MLISKQNIVTKKHEGKKLLIIKNTDKNFSNIFEVEVVKVSKNDKFFEGITRKKNSIGFDFMWYECNSYQIVDEIEEKTVDKESMLLEDESESKVLEDLLDEFTKKEKEYFKKVKIRNPRELPHEFGDDTLYYFPNGITYSVRYNI